MTLQNRVNPFGELISIPARGMFLGNRGGRIHRNGQLIGKRHWASRRWICCLLEFRERHREVWAEGYTQVFFLDEPTALSAGHRPCFECRRRDAKSFAACWQCAFCLTKALHAPEMDELLHAERVYGRAKRIHRRPIDVLPDGVFIALPTAGTFAVRGDKLLPWTPGGYDQHVARPLSIDVDVLTPPSIVAVLGAGYRPLWHPSAN
jgi:hypothetical protein